MYDPSRCHMGCWPALLVFANVRLCRHQRQPQPRGFLPSRRSGPNPTLPRARRAETDSHRAGGRSHRLAVGYERRSAADGLAVSAFASGLAHPRWLYVLPNGDVLVAETNAPKRPKDEEGVKAKVMKKMRGKAGAGDPSANRITLLRDADGDGVAEMRSVLVENLYSPFGMALVGVRPLCGEHRRHREVSVPRRRHAHRGGARARSPICRVANATTTGPRTSSPTATARGSTPPWAPTAMWPSTAWLKRRAAPPSGKSTSKRAPKRCLRRACAIPTAWRGNRRAARCGPSPTSATSSAMTSCLTT